MIGSKEAQREPLPDGTTVIFLNNKEIVIRSPLAENRNALFYEAFDRNTGRVIVMKEFFPGHWVRHDSAPVLNGCEQYSAEEVRPALYLAAPSGRAGTADKLEALPQCPVRHTGKKAPVCRHAPPAGRHGLAETAQCLSGNGRHDRRAGLPAAGADAGVHLAPQP